MKIPAAKILRGKLMKNISINKIIDFVKQKYIYILLGVGAFLLLLTFIPQKENEVEIGGTYTSEQYISDTEEKLESILSKMLGTKNINVMITLNNSVENVFADTTKVNTDISENLGTDDSKKEQKDSKENQYIIIKDKNGNEQALVLTQVMPQIRGVLVVCPNGNNTVIKEMVKSAVVTVLDISSKKVCVVGGTN